jgi:methyl-accepting chemotaxis protein
MRELVGDGMATIEESLTALEDIVGHVEDANAGVQSINEATDEQANSAQEVVAMVDDVVTLSEETNQEAANVSAAAEEQTASVTQIAQSAQSLTDEATHLQEMVSAFEVDERSTAPSGHGRGDATTGTERGVTATDGGEPTRST